ncbi:hypothetical protein [Janibacter sp. YB324]|uniref:hypothetical protein n=1 Tax=Janibacter sp. YB324 TaxID=2761047 RepID=UPI00210729CD|nr:hypothetical protein [Janibacter sp. YB324]
MYTTQSTPVRPTPGVEAFTPVQLLRLTQLFASDPALPDTLGPDPDRPGERTWRLLADSPRLQVWLIRKPSAAATSTTSPTSVVRWLSPSTPTARRSRR